MSYYYTFFALLLFFCHSSGNIIHPRVARQAEYTDCNNSSCGKSTEPPFSPDTNPIDSPTRNNYSICGISDIVHHRIIGVQNSSLGAWPWIVTIGYLVGNDSTIRWKCGGSLISERWVLTAGHCTVNIGSLRLTTARMGDLHLDESVDDGASPVDIQVERIITHPQFDGRTLANDIALLHLKSPVTFTKNIRPVCLLSTEEHRSDKFYAGKSLLVAGWKNLSFGEDGSKMLQETHVNIVDRDSCAQTYRRTKISIDIQTLCASGQGVDACQGNSGGPLILPVGSAYYLAGIVSTELRCHNPEFPGRFTEIAYFSDWITSVTGIKI